MMVNLSFSPLKYISVANVIVSNPYVEFKCFLCHKELGINDCNIHKDVPLDCPSHVSLKARQWITSN